MQRSVENRKEKITTTTTTATAASPMKQTTNILMVVKQSVYVCSVKTSILCVKRKTLARIEINVRKCKHPVKVNQLIGFEAALLI